ncbi:hypothetical protein JX265_011372 [Neoarthrinium moseri]|uniref:Uncharacterized protein n=1 Tax=Neoarthrinium moseri TaxID=1658444 RepID=A0A9P9WCL8_9PEZI|nr:uncharacterized protein JN550_009962 [Neoarthrinium moseri]KAI1857171.1 hypothetical protein JX265_011372 [Neoarthrinium moseri]KAI1862815.1 hypothetical protein JN550_009962 [Neoarthrinium moseri]
MHYKLAFLSTIAMALTAEAKVWGVMTENFDAQGARADFASDHSGDCVSFTLSNAFWNDKVSYVQVKTGTCTFYVDAGCSGASAVFHAGDSVNLSSNFNDKFSSFVCVD